jgi:hypothetical protein
MDNFYTTMFHVFLVLKRVYDAVTTTGVFVTTRLITAAHSRDYVFFSGYSTPYLKHMVKAQGPGIPQVTWFYNLDTQCLSRGEGEVKHLPWLGASIKFNGMNLYSLDDFVSELTYVNSRNEAPSPAVIMGAWSLYSGIVLDNQAGLDLFVITEEGDTDTFSPWSFTPINYTVKHQFIEGMHIEYDDLHREAAFPSFDDRPAPDFEG